MRRDLNLSEFEAALGLGIYPWAFGVAPLVLAPLSEDCKCASWPAQRQYLRTSWALTQGGRNPIYYGSLLVFTVSFIPVALAKVCRAYQSPMAPYV